MFIVLIIIQWLHVFCGIFWFGGTLFLDFVVIPSLIRLPIGEQRSFNKPFAATATRVITPIATLAIILGLIRGTVLGPVKSLDFLFGTGYGLTFLLGFLAAIATYLWGIFVVSRQAHRLNEIPVDEQALAEGKLPLVYTRQLALVQRVAMLELLGFVAIFTCMILMRFGL